MKDKYLYPAVFEYAHDGINVSFPDLSGAFTCGDDTEEAMKMAKEVLELHLYGMEKEGEEIPSPSVIMKTKDNERVIMIEVYMPTVRTEMDNKAVNKMVTIPNWLVEAAKKQNVNFSQTLQAALLAQLGITSTSSAPKRRAKKDTNFNLG